LRSWSPHSGALALSFLLLAGGVAEEPSVPRLELVPVPAGEFLMGTDEWGSDESPARAVTLPAFSIAVTETTNAQYHAFWLADGGASSRHTPLNFTDEDRVAAWTRTVAAKPDHPVVGVTWFDAAAYAAWLGMRLPTEAEWEKAARGTDGRLWSWGNAFDGRIGTATLHANLLRDGSTPMPVGRFVTGASPYGALDMIGNVREWTADWYSETYYRASGDIDPKGPATGTWRAVRGGSWTDPPENGGVTRRYTQRPGVATSFTGFRVARDGT